MAKQRRGRKPQEPVKILTKFLYNMLLAVAALVGAISYAGGVSLEHVLLRVFITMLLGVVLAYAADFALWYTFASTAPKAGDVLPPLQVEIASRARHIEPVAEPPSAGVAAVGSQA